MAQVYVSYGRGDLDAALPIIEAISEAGLTVWHQGKLSAGSVWLEEVRRELDNAKCVVLLWSKAAAQSDYLQQEIGWAIQAWSSEAWCWQRSMTHPCQLGWETSRPYRSEIRPIPVRS